MRFLFAVGLLVGIGGVVLAAACVVLAVVTAFDWLRAVILDARVTQQPIERRR
jgi:hypothetical protein